MVVLYHGTSSRFIEDILKNGLGHVENTGKWSEVRQILSKYIINPEILTDEFFEKYWKFISFGSGFREEQAKDGDGPFGVVYNEIGPDKYFSAPVYAKFATNHGVGEFEESIIHYLNTIDHGGIWYIGASSEDLHLSYECTAILKENIKPKYIDSDGNLYVYKDDSYKTDLPILLRFEVPDEDIVIKEDRELRVKNAVKPEQITGIVFLPPFRFDTDWHLSDDNEDRRFDKFIPDQKFLSKEEFFKELKKRQKQQSELNAFDVKDNDGNLLFMFSFPTENIACAQKYKNGQISCAYFYARDGHLNNGLIARKVYENGQPIRCDFFNPRNCYGTARVLYQNGKPNTCQFVYPNGYWDKVLEELPIKKANSVLRIFSKSGNRLTSEQLLILEYEKKSTPEKKRSFAKYIDQARKQMQTKMKSGAKTALDIAKVVSGKAPNGK